MKLSRQFINAVKLSEERAYRIALAAECDPTFVSKLINGITKAKPDDPRLLRLGKILNLSPAEIFENQ